MERRIPSFFMLVPGPWTELAPLLRALEDSGIRATPTSGDTPTSRGEVRVELVAGDDFASACAWTRNGPLDQELVNKVGACSHAAVVEYALRFDEDPAALARLGRALRDAGGVVVRMEASGAASAWEPWLEHLERPEPEALNSCGVVLVRDDEDVMFTCGMHHFDLPDAQIALADAEQAMDWLDTFNVYQLEEQPALRSGHTFAPHAAAESRVLERWPDHRHDPGDGRYNPFGVWRLQERGTARISPGDLVPTIIPSLVALLHSAERSQGKALSRPEVEALVSSATAIAMTPEDVTALERSRGYADIEPEFAWEQWQIVRTTL